MKLKLSKSAYKMLIKIYTMYSSQPSDNDKHKLENKFAQSITAKALLADNMTSEQYQSVIQELSIFGFVTYYQRGAFKLLENGKHSAKYRKRIWIQDNYSNIMSTISTIIAIFAVILNVLQ